MTHKVGPKGQVVIPKDLREEFGLEPGDEVEFWRDGDHVAVRAVHTRGQLKGRLAGRPLVDELERDRAADRRREGSR
jgi:AbrB family looped-hinge helix DNA binding protein